MRQAEVFIRGEGAAWMQRNQGRYDPKFDPVLEAIENYGIVPDRVLEVGCANGRRLEAIHDIYGSHVMGIDPCNDAITKNVPVFKGTADDLSGFRFHPFDLLIYGWCLYLCDPEDYFKIASEGDRVLQDGGFLIIYDFKDCYPHYKRPYKHKEGLFSHHFDFPKLWINHPAYKIVRISHQDETSVTILKKKMATAFPVKE